MGRALDERIESLIENGLKSRHRSIFVIVGDRSHDRVVYFLYRLARTVVKSVKPRRTVLWCYEGKQKLGRSSHERKGLKLGEKLNKMRPLDPEKADSFPKLMNSRILRHCFYRNLDIIRGRTYGMCILKDFEALTPDILARTIDTVEAGGMLVFLIRSISSLSCLATSFGQGLHKKLLMQSHSHVVSSFHDGILRSLATCKACLFMDDKLHIIPISPCAESIIISSKTQSQEPLPDMSQELLHLKSSLINIFPVGPLVGLSTTFDQGKAVSTLLDAVFGKALHHTMALTGSRGRGKSAALGLAVAGAVAAGYSNIFVTAPSLQNLRSLFKFVHVGLHLLKYEEHLHYDLVRSCDPGVRNEVMQIDIHKQGRQTIQYIEPCGHLKLSEVDLLVIDEADAIPLPVIDLLLGPYSVFLSSTVNGYKDTGCSLSLKLFQYLKEKRQMAPVGTNASQSHGVFQKLELREPIRYASGDPVESWFDDLLSLDATKKSDKTLSEDKEIIQQTEVGLLDPGSSSLVENSAAGEDLGDPSET